jgi:hypothetical protein
MNRNRPFGVRPALSLLVASALIVSGVDRGLAQRRVSPSASLEVQVPAVPASVRIGGRLHLVYEVHITNVRTVDLALARVDVLGDTPGESPLASYQDTELRSRLSRVGARPDASDTRVMSAGARVVLFVWLALDEGAAVPSTLRHRIALQVPSREGEAGAVETGPTDVRRDPPVVLDAPLRGGPWVAVYDPAMNGGHRRALFAVAGTMRIPARFAIDWIRLGDDGQTARGDRSILANHYGYGAEVLAVADGVVTAVVAGLPEPTVPITPENAAGNYVTIDLGGGRFASYEHVQPQSITVKVGDHVRSGQVLARLGASGSVSSGPHLHFHISDANSPLGAEGLPYEFRSFEVLGAFESIEALVAGKAWAPLPIERMRKQQLELPRQQTVLRF